MHFGIRLLAIFLSISFLQPILPAAAPQARKSERRWDVFFRDNALQPRPTLYPEVARRKRGLTTLRTGVFQQAGKALVASWHFSSNPQNPFMARPPASNPAKQEQLFRSGRLFEADMTLRYGRLPSDHRLMTYVQQLFEEAMGTDANQYRLVICPEWSDVNAVALPNGVIMLSGGLLQFVQSPEELKAVLAHEAIHIREHHAEISRRLLESLDQGKGNLMKATLSAAGLQRMQEYEADLRWVIEEFDKRRINPLGLLMFLEKLDEHDKQLRQRVQVDLAHGYALDRALNEESIFFFFDLAALSNELGQLPTWFSTEAQAIAKPDFMRLASEVPLRFAEGSPDYEAIQSRRVELADAITSEQLSIALSAVYGQLTSRLKFLEKKRMDAKNDDRVASTRQLIEILTERIDEELFSETRWPDPHRRAVARALYYEIHVGFPYGFHEAGERWLEDAALNRRQKADQPYFSSRNDFLLIAEVVGDPAFPDISGDTGKFLNRLLSLEANKLSWNEKDPTKAAADYWAWARRLSLPLASALTGKATYSISPASIRERALKLCINSIPSENAKARKEVIGYFEQSKVLSLQDAQGFRSQGKSVDELLKDIPRTPELEKLLKAIERQHVGPFKARSYAPLIEEFCQTFAGKPVETLAQVFADFTAMLVEQANEIEMRHKSDSALPEMEPLYRKSHHAFRLFEVLIKKLPPDQYSENEINDWLFRGLGAISIGFRRNASLRLSTSEGIARIAEHIAQKAGTHYEEDYEEKGALDVHTVLSPKERAYIRKFYGTVEKTWLIPESSTEDLLRQYRFVTESTVRATYSTFDIWATTLNREIFLRRLAKKLALSNDWDTFFATVRQLESAGIPVSDLITENRSIFGAAITKLWHVMPKDLSASQFEDLVLAARWLEDPLLRTEVLSFYYAQQWPRLRFTQKLRVFFAKRERALFDLKRFGKFTEEDVRTKKQLDTVRQTLRREFNALMHTSAPELGFAALVSTVGNSPKLAQRFILALIRSIESDLELKEVLFNVFSDVHGSGDDSTPESFRDSVRDAEAAEHAMFRMGSGTKHALLRKLLTGEHGLVTSPEYRERFLLALVHEAIRRDKEAPLMRTIEEVISALGKIEEWKPVYFALQPLLADHLGTPPPKETPWKVVLWQQMEGEDFDLEPEVRKQDRAAVQAASDSGMLFEFPWRFESRVRVYSQDLLRAQLRSRGAISDENRQEPLSPLTFVLQFARQLGALGVRFLQLLPQFVELPEQYQAEFSKIYDANEGQSKPAALAVVEREWPDFWSHVARVEERVGGGSLFTVYRIVLHNGENHVLKVLNPNLEFLLQRMYGFIEHLLDQLIKLFGEKYATARLALEDVKEWIERDVRFEGFLAKDAVFREENEGYTAEGFGYRMHVPRSWGPVSKFFMLERFIQGKTLTKWDELVAEGHDMKQVVSLIVKNYRDQVLRGRAHSDVHVGNFLVTSENQVAILDRNFQLEFSPDMLELATLLLNPLDLLTTTPESFVDRLTALGGKSITAAQRDTLVKAWAEAHASIASGDWKVISHFLVTLRANGVWLPLELRLLFKNLNSLQHMAKKAGFENLIDAFLYTPPLSDLSASDTPPSAAAHLRAPTKPRLQKNSRRARASA